MLRSWRSEAKVHGMPRPLPLPRLPRLLRLLRVQRGGRMLLSGRSEGKLHVMLRPLLLRRRPLPRPRLRVPKKEGRRLQDRGGAGRSETRPRRQRRELPLGTPAKNRRTGIAR
jgi:hypothetical protein